MARVVVLVEGESDAVVVRRLLSGRGQDPEVVVAMGGVTNVRRHAEELRAGGADPVLLALGDVGERRYLEKVEPPLAGVFLCDRDLEEELFRALGRDQVLEAIAAIGDEERWATFCGQPEWRDRPVDDQLRRFVGTRSGRKAALADELGRRLRPGAEPPPLVALLDGVARYG
ncbi:hypothetical protein GCM10009623_22880 [Nocardioides aestuarii]|uniref:ATP-dependent endonuclease n=1 Tax=Nocardioides aestuarii TaxID=252231 RepID=A0ABW4TLN0_9ACTN